jgi:molybdopterin-guanine dinucleotide biosynthesis protein A
MGRDKSLIKYRDKAQRYYLYDVLSPICSNTIISCRKNQAREIPAGYAYVVDSPEFENNGPATALLSISMQFPGSPALLIACDYPYLNEEEINQFIQSIKDPEKPVAFFDPSKSKYIPVLAYYPKDAAIIICEHIKTPGYSLMQYLISQQAVRYIPKDLRCLIGVDNPEAMATVNLLK